jgi:heterodisulfide reductase subunit A2
MAEKVGVYVCHCGSNIAGKVDVEEIAKWAGENIDGRGRVARLQVHVLVARPEDDRGRHQERGTDPRRGGACSPHLHEKTFRRACSNAGLNPYLMDLTNIREHCSWVHKDRAAATEKAKGAGLGGGRASQVPGAARADVSSTSIRPRW